MKWRCGEPSGTIQLVVGDEQFLGSGSVTSVDGGSPLDTQVIVKSTTRNNHKEILLSFRHPNLEFLGVYVIYFPPFLSNHF